jgi:hypothetical protein
MNQKECVFLGKLVHVYVYNRVMDATSIGIKINLFLDKYSFLEEQKKIFKKWVILLQRT